MSSPIPPNQPWQPVIQISTSPPQKDASPYDFQMSNIVLRVGGQILRIVIIMLILYIGGPPVSFPADTIKKIFGAKGST